MIDLLWIDKIIADVCTIEGEPCLGSRDVISTGVGGLVAGAVAVWVYVWRKNGEYADRQNDIARIQANEIANNMDVLCMQGGRQRRIAAATRAPTMEIYEGLLSSGNIRYLGDELQEMLAQIRRDLDARPFDPDADRHALALKRLDGIMSGRHRHFTMIPLWMWYVRRRLHSKRFLV